uniref:Uncharacterized protein n=1 Tax=Glossina brevipalpis TaxID=37001 RepID=A0A1A9WZG3_9MUSC
MYAISKTEGNTFTVRRKMVFVEFTLRLTMNTSEMDIQEVESKLSDVTVTPIPRSQAHNYNRQREQQPQVEIAAVTHSSGGSHQTGSRNNANERDAGESDGPSTSKQCNNTPATTNKSVSVALVAFQYVRQLQAQLDLLQQHASNNIGFNSSISKATESSMLRNINENVPNPMALPSSHKQSSSPTVVTTQTSANITIPMTSAANLPSATAPDACSNLNKYDQLLAVIAEMARDLRPTYTGSRSATERLKRGIVHARILVRECIMELERSGRQ